MRGDCICLNSDADFSQLVQYVNVSNAPSSPNRHSVSFVSSFLGIDCFYFSTLSLVLLLLLLSPVWFYNKMLPNSFLFSSSIIFITTFILGTFRWIWLFVTLFIYYASSILFYIHISHTYNLFFYLFLRFKCFVFHLKRAASL